MVNKHPFTGTLLVQDTQTPLSNQCKLCERKKTQTQTKNTSVRLLSAYWKMQWYLAASGGVGHRKWVLCAHLFPFLSCLTSSLHVRCFIRGYSPMLTDGQSRDSGCTLGGQRPGYLYAVISADKCGQSCRPLFGQQTIGVCPLFHLVVSWLLTCLLPPSVDMSSQGHLSCGRFFYTLFTKLFQILKQTINTMQRAEQVMFCQMFMAMTTFYEQSLLFF